MSCKWVKQQGPAKGFDFDVSKVEQIFDLLLREKAVEATRGPQVSYNTRVTRETILQVASLIHPHH
jgi:hypothetical protein